MEYVIGWHHEGNEHRLGDPGDFHRPIRSFGEARNMMFQKESPAPE
jgi:hypothetical protein